MLNSAALYPFIRSPASGVQRHSRGTARTEGALNFEFYFEDQEATQTQELIKRGPMSAAVSQVSIKCISLRISSTSVGLKAGWSSLQQYGELCAGGEIAT